MPTPEQLARQTIDAMLASAGWVVQDVAELNLSAARGVAVREMQSQGGPADYILFVDGKALGIIEAKKEGDTLSTVAEQSERYSHARKWIPERWHDPLPFLYESTGVETFFRDQRDPDSRSRPVFWFHTPEHLLELVQEPDTLRARLKTLPAEHTLITEPLRECQIHAITGLEKSLAENRPRALLQMATGSGKTYTAVTGELTKEWREKNPDVESGGELLERILEKRRKTWNGKGKYKEPTRANADFDQMPPTTWAVSSMDALTCHLTSDSRDWKQYYNDEGYAVFVMTQNVRPLKFDSTPVIRIDPPEGDRDKARSEVLKNDLLVTIVGANTGDVCRVHNSFADYYVCQSVALLRPVESATAKYLELYMNSEEHGQDQFEKWMYGQGRPHLSLDQLRSTAVFVPPLDEQH